MEHRCFGERKDQRPAEARTLNNRCHHAAMSALLLGRTMIGERVWDVFRAIDVLAQFPEVGTDRIGCILQTLLRQMVGEASGDFRVGITGHHWLYGG